MRLNSSLRNQPLAVRGLSSHDRPAGPRRSSSQEGAALEVPEPDEGEHPSTIPRRPPDRNAAYGRGITSGAGRVRPGDLLLAEGVAHRYTLLAHAAERPLREEGQLSLTETVALSR